MRWEIWKKEKFSVNSPELPSEDAEVKDKSVAVSVNLVPFSHQVMVIEKTPEVSANVVTQESEKSPEVSANVVTQDLTNVNQNDSEEVHVKDGSSANTDEEINYSQPLFNDDKVEVPKTDEEKSVIDKGTSNDTSLVTNVDGVKDEKGNSTLIIDVESVTAENLEGQKPKNDNQDDLSPAIVLKPLPSKDGHSRSERFSE